MFSFSLKNKSKQALLLITVIYLLIKLYFILFPTTFPIAGQEMVFGWGMIAATLILGFLGYLCTKKMGFTDIWQSDISNFQRFILPFFIGLIYGIITIAPRLLYHDDPLHPLALRGTIHVTFPNAVPFYVFGAIFMEIFLKLVCIGILTWLFSSVIFRGKYAGTIFWIVNLLVAFYEPMPYIQQSIAAGKSPLNAVTSEMLGVLYISNIISGYIGKRFGFLASLTMRLTHYAVWHIIFPLF
jgi:hypothetical protein